MSAALLIQHGDTVYYPAVEEGVTLTWERKGAPGQLKFSVVKDGILKFSEGDPVKMMVDGTDIFYGFVFTKSQKANSPAIDVVAYDQLRYLKNKDTIIEEGLTASDLLRRIAGDYRLNLGSVEDTRHRIDAIVEEDSTLFDMLQSALDETLTSTGQLYCLYDAAGKLCLRNVAAMTLNLLIDKDTGETFDYASSIDDMSYNKIKLTYDNSKTGKREVYVAQDSNTMNQWGVLQYFEKLQSPIGAADKANSLLRLYNQKTRKLTVRNAFGDIRVRAGSSVVVSLDLGDVQTNNYMMVEKVTHNFKENEYFMDLTLVGGEFIA